MQFARDCAFKYIYVTNQHRPNWRGINEMKKLLSMIIISLLFSLSLLLTLTFVMKPETVEQKNSFRNLADNIALNISGQGLSMPFIPNSEAKDGFKAISSIENLDKDSCNLYVIIMKDNKHLTMKYPCQIQDSIIYSVGLDYAHEYTFAVMEYILIGSIAFIICFAFLGAIKVIKS